MSQLLLLRLLHFLRGLLPLLNRNLLRHPKVLFGLYATRRCTTLLCFTSLADLQSTMLYLCAIITSIYLHTFPATTFHIHGSFQTPTHQAFTTIIPAKPQRLSLGSLRGCMPTCRG